MKQGYRSIIKQTEFMKMVGANFINRLGDSVDMIAFSWLMYALTNSAGWSAIVVGINMIPNVLVQPIAGAIVEKLNKKKIMISADLIRGGLTGVVALLYMGNMLAPWMLLLVTFLNNTFEAFRNPATNALIPKILEKEHFEFGISFSQTSSRICELVGAALGGLLIAVIGIAGAIWVDVFSFLLSACIITFIHVKAEEISVIKLHMKEYLNSMKDGFLYIKHLPILMLTCISGAIINMLLVPFNAFETPYISGILHQGAQLLSASNIALTLGMGIGAFLYPYAHKFISNRSILISGGMTIGIYYLSLICIAKLPPSPSIIYTSLSIAAFLFGCCISLLISAVSVSLMKRIDTTYMARVSGVFSAITVAPMPITSFLMGILSTRLSILAIYIVFALFTFILFIGMIFIKGMKEL